MINKRLNKETVQKYEIIYLINRKLFIEKYS